MIYIWEGQVEGWKKKKKKRENEEKINEKSLFQK